MTDEASTRRHERFPAKDVRGNFSYAVHANVLNLSMGGLAVRTHTQLNIGRRYRFTLGKSRDSVELGGTVRWCRLAGTEKQDSGDIVPVYEAGIGFEEVLSDKAEELLEFLEKNIVLDLRRRIFGRFKAEGRDPVTLESESRFLVQQLSVSGMMIESEVALKPDSLFELEMQLGDNPFWSRARIVYLAEINVQDQALRYRLGVEFLGTPADQVHKLERFIRQEMQRQGAPAE
jgi:hypothetical protein